MSKLYFLILLSALASASSAESIEKFSCLGGDNLGTFEDITPEIVIKGVFFLCEKNYNRSLITSDYSQTDYERANALVSQQERPALRDGDVGVITVTEDGSRAHITVCPNGQCGDPEFSASFISIPEIECRNDDTQDFKYCFTHTVFTRNQEIRVFPESLEEITNFRNMYPAVETQPVQRRFVTPNPFEGRPLDCSIEAIRANTIRTDEYFESSINFDLKTDLETNFKLQDDFLELELPTDEIIATYYSPSTLELFPFTCPDRSCGFEDLAHLGPSQCDRSSGELCEIFAYTIDGDHFCRMSAPIHHLTVEVTDGQ